MKHFILTFTCLLSLISVSAQSVARFAYTAMTGNSVSDDYVSTTVRTVADTGDEIRISFSFGAPIIVPDTLYQGANWCFIDDFGLTHEKGTPSLPIRNEYLCLPSGAQSATVEVSKIIYSDIHCEITPSHPMPRNGDFSVFTKANVPAITGSYISESFEYVRITGFETTGALTYVLLSVTPCQYDASTTTLRVAHELEFVIKPIFTSNIVENVVTGRSQARGSRTDAPAASSVSTQTAQYSASSLGYPYREGDPLYVPDEYFDYFDDVFISYLIITPEKYLEAADKLALFKKKRGITTYVASRETWTEKQAKDSIKACFDADKNLRYVLLLGNVNDIPARELATPPTIGNQPTHFTDFYYGCIDNEDAVTQAVLVGRFPVNSLDDAYATVDKTISYSSMSQLPDEFFKTGVHIAKFAGYTDDYDTYVTNAEACRDVAVCNNVEVKRLYSADRYAEPNKLNNGKILPDELRKPNYAWNADKYAIAEAVNAGANYVLYRGHGSPEEWEDPSFKTEDFDLLQNGKLNPVFFSLTCLSGRYSETDCFAGMLTNKSNGGAVAVIAGSQSTLTEYNNLASVGMMTCLWEKSKSFEGWSTNGNPAIPASCLGFLLRDMSSNAYTFNYPEYKFHKEAYNLFGDPSLVMWTEIPEEYSESEIDVEEYDTFQDMKYRPILPTLAIFDNIAINLEGERCFVGVYDTTSDKSYLMFGSKMRLPYFDPNRFVMTIYGMNRVPKTIHCELPSRADHPVIFQKSPRVSVSPNPASTTCTIKYEFNTSLELRPSCSKVVVTSVQTGAVENVFSTSKLDGSISMDVSSLAAGQYVVSLVDCSSGSDVILATTRLVVV